MREVSICARCTYARISYVQKSVAYVLAAQIALAVSDVMLHCSDERDVAAVAHDDSRRNGAGGTAANTEPQVPIAAKHLPAQSPEGKREESHGRAERDPRRSDQ
jgi:hypothetical protein